MKILLLILTVANFLDYCATSKRLQREFAEKGEKYTQHGLLFHSLNFIVAIFMSLTWPILLLQRMYHDIKELIKK